ncbi:hypothetical protein EA462_02205 [Natrarchaeobius halalkaliphilus]|uniref:Nucleotidyl transferase domain-containing protein n=1 Tax=Natrarchaeobius halalkaliphilus TaxID=1679091 RepID=A0A3N6MGH0_9EURY|nr:sugar phosphate nucleotidyltransferase [Natrarchaeobius halalkaliphilus]RQG93046.1 hypothetical protein EA462_02205 [Natrarchaeobius halalkaliphilus]
MAGKGSRFKDAGISCPKHEVIVDDRPMFDWAMQSLKSFYDDEFVFITQAADSPSEFLAERCETLGIDRYEEVTLTEYTDGQASTALAADDSINDSQSVAIFNIDTYVEEGKLSPEIIKGDGFIPVFETTGERWSFVKEDSKGNVVSVSEKEKISDLATVGFYYFDQWSYFADAYAEIASETKSKYGETYVAPLYNSLIDSGESVETHCLDESAVHVLGTPQDLCSFYPEFDPNNHP